MAAFSRRTINAMLKTWRKIKNLTRLAMTGRVAPDLTETDEVYIKKLIHECVYAKGGEVSSRARSVELGKIYLGLSREGRHKFMKILAYGFDIDYQAMKNIIQDFLDSKDDDTRTDAELHLSKAMISPRVKLLKQFNTLPNGFKFLIDFRAELLTIKKNDPYLKMLDVDLKNILSSWFDIGLLDLKEITWQSPASLLEKLIKYEAVHEIRSWADLKNRLDSDRLCYSFFHNKMPDEPLIFVEVALTDEMTSNIQNLLDEKATTMKPKDADTAIFYSISNAQKGLAGINLGNFLIKRVVTELSKQMKGLKHFATLSPLPGFRKWLDPILLKGDESILDSSEIKNVKSVRYRHVAVNAAHELLDILNSNWVKNPELAEVLKPIMMRICAQYLFEVKKVERVFDSVANFHLANGARIERLNWLGDISQKGMAQSAGIMVNYYYKLSNIERNHEMYITESRINASKAVKKWLKK